MGEELGKAELAKGGQPFQARSTGTAEVPVEIAPRLADIGISKNQSSRYQQLAAIPDENVGDNDISSNPTKPVGQDDRFLMSQVWPTSASARPQPVVANTAVNLRPSSQQPAPRAAQ